MRHFSLMLLSLVSSRPKNEYLCGNANEEHFHVYGDQNFLGHFKIGKDKYKILRRPNHETRDNTAKNRYYCDDAFHGIEHYNNRTKITQGQFIYTGSLKMRTPKNQDFCVFDK